MQEDERTEVDVGDEAAPEPSDESNGHHEGEASSIIGGLRQQYTENSKDRWTDLEIPGFNEELWCRYRLLDWDVMKEIGEAAQRSKSQRRELHAQADIIARACDQFLVRKGQELVPLNEEAETGDLPIKYDVELGRIIGFDILDNKQRPRARLAVLRLFNNDFAVSMHHNELLEWMREARREEDESYAGESRAVPTS